MNGAATQDLRLMRVWPVVRDVLARGAGTPRAAAAAAQVDAWLAAGGSRLDADLDGKVDSAGAADPRRRLAQLANAVLAPRARRGAPPGARSARPERPRAADRRLERLQRLVVVRPEGPADAARPARARARTRRTSAAAATSRAARRRCGRRSTRPRPSSRAAQGADPAAWRADATKERIVFAPGILTRTMRGSNKPTFQQAITFATHR